MIDGEWNVCCKVIDKSEKGGVEGYEDSGRVLLAVAHSPWSTVLFASMCYGNTFYFKRKS